ncbi:MAG: hypothetical protein QXD89_01945 [Candidatus Aenigmatarchaeota archaeon]
MKLQADYGFYISLMIFITAIVFIFYEIVSFYPLFYRELKKEVLYFEGYQISQILVNDPGEPADWYSDLSEIERIGLASEFFNTFNLLSIQKVNAVNFLCNNEYERFKKLIGTNYDVNLVLILLDGRYLINCTKNLSREIAVKVSRIIALDDQKSYGELIIWVY